MDASKSQTMRLAYCVNSFSKGQNSFSGNADNKIYDLHIQHVICNL